MDYLHPDASFTPEDVRRAGFDPMSAQTVEPRDARHFLRQRVQELRAEAEALETLSQNLPARLTPAADAALMRLLSHY